MVLMWIFEAIAVWLRETLLPWGGAGLMILAVCDSSFLSLPEVNDLLLMTFSMQEPDRMLRFATLTTLGSVMGCMVLYTIGRKGGESLLSRRFSDQRLHRVRGWYRKYGVWAVIVPSLLPPPMPFKIFVLSAGAFGISWPHFIAAVSLGRGIRYFSQGILAVTYGPMAIEFVKGNFGMLGLILGIVIVSAVVGVVYARRRMKGSEA